MMKRTLEIAGKTYIATEIVKDRLGIADGVVNNWIKRGWLPRPLRLGRRNYFDRDLFEELLAKGQGDPIILTEDDGVIPPQIIGRR